MDEQNKPQPLSTDGFQRPNQSVAPQFNAPNQAPPQQFSPTQPLPAPQQLPSQQPGMYPMPTQPAPKRGGKLKLALIGAFLSVLLLGGGAAAYMQFVVNSPKKIWERAMSTTARGLEAVVATQETPWPGSKTEATFSISSPIAADGSMDGAWYDSNGSATFDLGAAGLRVNGEMRMIGIESSTTPDIYLRVQGVESILGLLAEFSGMPLDSSADQLIQEVDDQWFSIDHTLIDQLAASGGTAGTPELSPEDMQKITKTVTRVVSETLLATNEKAVFKVIEEIGKEDFEGTDTYKYKVGVDKENLKNFLNEMKNALRDTKVSVLVTADGSQTYDEVFDLESVMTEIDKLDFNKAKADVWVESSGKFVRNIRIYENNDDTAKNFIDIAMPYTSGDIVPIQVKITIDEEGSKGTAAFGFDVHLKGENFKFWVDVNIDAEGQKMAGKAEFKAARSEEQVNVQKPDGARNIYELLGIIGGMQPGGFDDSLLLEDDFSQQFPAPDDQMYDDLEL